MFLKRQVVSMDYTRDPIIETIITPKEGCKLVVRNSKGVSQEEYFLEAVEIVSFGQSFFFRSQERPKAFLVPVTDYEVVEVREAKMILKNVTVDRSIKIAGGRETKEEVVTEDSDKKQDGKKVDKKREKRRQNRRRRGGREEGDVAEQQETTPEEPKEQEAPKEQKRRREETPRVPGEITPSVVASLLPPPSTLISETIAKYKREEFYKPREKEPTSEAETPPPLNQSISQIIREISEEKKGASKEDKIQQAADSPSE